MLLETIESEGLAHLSYVIGDDGAGVCAVVDPRRDVQVYLDIARRHHSRITHILETHIHADFVSGSRELAAATGAPIYVGAAEGYGFEHIALHDGDQLDVGRLRFRVLHTPGHTPEHVCYVVSGEHGAAPEWGVFTGDTLFAGEVGRPDLLGHGSEEQLARRLYHSLHEKLLTLGDEVVIYPAHGEGSPCGGNIGERNTSTIGYERQNNPKLQVDSEDEFIRLVLSDLPPAPAYYPRMKQVNAAGPRILGCLPNIPSLDASRFREVLDRPRTIIVDTREIEAFGGAHIAGALNIALRPEFPIWAGWMLRPECPILLVLGEEADVDTVQLHLLRIGIEDVAGFLRRGMREWIEAGLPFERLPQMSVHELKDRLDRGLDGLQILDVRREDEWRRGHIPQARHVYAPFLSEHLDRLDRERPIVTYCGSGYRASIAASLLQRHGFREVFNLPGSIKAWRLVGYPLEQPADAAAPQAA